MLNKVNLLSKYPKTKGRDQIANERLKLTDAEKEISRQFGYEYFDGPRKFGLGGYYYHPKFFTEVVKDFIKSIRGIEECFQNKPKKISETEMITRNKYHV